MKDRAWSYSVLSAFELCPRKYHAEKVSRRVSEKSNHAADYGTEVHKAFENRLLRNKKLPLDLRHHEKIMVRLANHEGESLPEQRIAINADFESTGFFDDDVWCRGVVDFGKLKEPNLLLVDHKTGRMKEEFDQLDLMAVMMFHHLEEVENIIGVFYWTKNKRFTKKNYARSDIADIWGDFLPRVEKFQKAFETDSFPAKSNFLCKRHCPVKDCKYNGS